MKNYINKNFWKNKKVFVTGHTGFKGSWLCIFLNSLGSKVTGYSLKPKSNPNLYKLSNVKKVIEKSIISDVRNYKKLHKSIKESKAEIVFHLAAQPLVRDSYRNPKETFDININGTINVIESVRNIPAVKSLVIITTDKVYDISKNRIFKEDDLLGGKDPYSASKVCCEYLFNSYLKSFFGNNKNQRIATVRAGNVIGGGDYSKDRLIPDIYKSIKNKQKIVLRNPNSVRPWQHVLEPLSGYIILAEKMYKKYNNKISPNWNFGPNISSCKSVKYIAQKFSKNSNCKIKIIKVKNKNYKSETDLLRLSNLKSKKYLKWYPKWNLNKTINKIIEWNNEVNETKKSFDICSKQIEEYLKD